MDTRWKDRTAHSARGHITYREWAGDGPVVLAIPGTLMDRTMFDPQGEFLAPTYRLIAVDSRGRSDDRWQGPYTMTDLAQDYLALADLVGIDTFSVFGMSMGGYVAAFLALAAPGRVDSIIFQNSITTIHPSPNQHIWELLREQDEMGPWTTELAKQVFGASAQRHRPELIEHWIHKWYHQKAQKVYWEVESQYTRPDIDARLGELTMPSLVVHSEDEKFWSKQNAEVFCSRLANGRMVVITGAGHTAQLEVPDTVNEIVGDFLADVYAQ